MLSLRASIAGLAETVRDGKSVVVDVVETKTICSSGATIEQ